MKIKTVTITPDVEAVLRKAVLMGNMLVLQGQLSRDLYVKTNKVLELVGFKWSKKLKGHVGEGDSMDRLKEALSDGTVVDEKATFQFYETPDELADRMVELANIKVGDRVLEPSAGKGALVHAIFRKHKNFPRVFVCELEPKMRAALSQIPGVAITGEDFLAHNAYYDCILMNPPFSDGQDIAHVQHAYKLLSTGGVLVAITSPSWTFNAAKKYQAFRTWLSDLRARGDAVRVDEELPKGTFKASGTGVNSRLLCIQKPRALADQLVAVTPIQHPTASQRSKLTFIEGTKE